MSANENYIGASVRRLEDHRFITGHGQYVDDIAASNLAYAEIVRSPVPHARILSIDVAAARRVPGVVAVYTAADILPHVFAPFPLIEAGVAQRRQAPPQYPMATDESVYEGEPLAIVVGDTRNAAADGAAAVEIDFDVLPAVIDLDQAIAPGSATVREDASDNIAWDVTFPGTGDIEQAFADAAVFVKERIVQQRVAASAMEPRVVLADFRGSGDQLTLWTSSQMPHFMRLYISEGLRIPESKFRVISPDVGGAFGSKMGPYAEEYLVPIVSKLVGRPVKWTETRSENLTSTSHGRGHVFDVEACAAADGTLLGLKIVQLSDVGAYIGRNGGNAVVAIHLSGGCYRWHAIQGRSLGVLTNKMWTGPYRGAGRPEATHLCERVMDLLAAELDMDPADLRRRNFITEFPHKNQFGYTYDSGDYEATLNRALEYVDYPGLRAEQAAARREGRFLGIGIGSYVEISGFGPSANTAANDGEIGLVESAVVRVHPNGSVEVSSGTHSHGQGHATAFAQIAANALGVSIDRVQVHEGDTADTPFGHGTYGSRSIPVGGVAINLACEKVVAKALQIAANLFEADQDDIEFQDGEFSVRGTAARKSFAEIAFAAYNKNLPAGMEQGLEAVAFFDPPNFTWPFGSHVCVVEVDPETGVTKILRYVAVDDCGNVINPMIVEGQIHGGVLQGVAQALSEEISYDPDSGALIGGTFLDYLIPTIGEIVPTEVYHTVTPTPSNPLGVKGVGEAGTIASSVAVINAICDALSPLGVKHIDMPASPQRVWERVQAIRSESVALEGSAVR